MHLVRISLSPGIFYYLVLIELYLACRNKLSTWPFGIDWAYFGFSGGFLGRARDTPSVLGLYLFIA